MKSWMALLLTAGVWAVEARAQEPTVEAYLDPPEVAIGEQFRLVVEVNGARTVEGVVIPELFDFAHCINPLDPAVGVKVGDADAGSGANTVTLSYVFVATQAGFFEMRPFRITADGQAMETEALAVLVGTSEVTVKARVEPAEVRVGDAFELSVEVFGSRSEYFEFVVPDVFDFAEADGGCGGTDRRFLCRLRATTPGEVVIPPVQVIDQGETYESEPVTLVVTDEPPRATLHAHLESGSIWVGGEFTLRFEVVGTHELDEEPDVPETAFAEFLGVGWPMLTGGSGGDRMVYSYRFRAVQPGRFEIGPIGVVAFGRTLESDPVSVTVNELPAVESDPSDDLFLTGAPDKTRAYVGQPVVVAFSVPRNEYRGLLLLGTKSWPPSQGFDVLDRGPLPGKMTILPTQPGLLEVGAATLEARILDDPPDLWDSEPLTRRRGGGTLSAWASTHWLEREYTSHILASDPFTIEVLPLPDEDRPASFQGHVGTLEVSSRIDGTTPAVGETVTLEVKVSIDGNVEGLTDPEIDFPSAFEVAAPEVDTHFPNRGDVLAGTRTYTYVLTATTPGTYVIPAVEMSYFDAGTESYGTTRSHPFTVTVVPAGAEAR